MELVPLSASAELPKGVGDESKTKAFLQMYFNRVMREKISRNEDKT